MSETAQQNTSDPTPALSPQAIAAIVQVVTGGPYGSPDTGYGVYRSGPELELFLANCGIDFHLASGSRVPAVREILTSVNQQTTGLVTLKRVIEAAVDKAAYRVGDDLEKTVRYLNDSLAANGFHLEELAGRYRMLSTASHSMLVDSVQQYARALDHHAVVQDMDRAISQADQDPEGGVTSACAALESVCRAILHEMAIPLPKTKDVSHLAAEVQRHLDLSPARKDIGPDMKQVLGGLTTVIGGVGALRTHAGTAHGRDPHTPRTDARVARLAIHAASTVAVFLIETWTVQKAGRASQGSTPAAVNAAVPLIDKTLKGEL